MTSRKFARFWHRPSNTEIAGILLALVGIGLAIYFGIRSAPDRRILALQVEPPAELTASPRVPGLQGTFTFDGRPVQRLWISRLRLINAGNQTIIGSGPRSDLFGDALHIPTVQGTEILRADFLDNDADAKASVRQPDLVLEFEQWRPREQVTLSLYFTTSETIDTPNLILAPSPRQIVDGTITADQVSASGRPVDQEANSTPGGTGIWILGAVTATVVAAFAVGFVLSETLARGIGILVLSVIVLVLVYTTFGLLTRTFSILAPW